MLRKLAVLTLLFTVVHSGASMAKARVIKRKPVYGQGISRLPTGNTLPTAYNLATQAITDADQWWTRQGSAPPPLQLDVAASVDGEHTGYGWYGSGRMQITPTYLDGLNRALAHSATRRGKVEALVGLWSLMAHERGHNIGYQHIPGGIMDAGWTSPPGAAYEWAASVLPKRKVLRKKRGGK